VEARPRDHVMVAGARVGYDYFAVSKNDSKIKLVGSGTSPPGASRYSHGATWLPLDNSLAIRMAGI
jgi:hypothetical protein